MAPTVAIVGAGPAGLWAAERIAATGAHVTIYDRMPSPGRKLLMAGRGGLNLTHSEPLARFAGRYGDAATWLAPLLANHPPEALRAWAEGLGQTTFVGSSGRVFPKVMKASPLLRAWLARLSASGVTLRLRQTWMGFTGANGLVFRDASETIDVHPDATLCALGGASWPRLGSDGAWQSAFAEAGIPVTPLAASNCGVVVAWSAHLRDRHDGQPLKRIAATVAERTVRGEGLITRYGLEGGAIYALSSEIRTALARDGSARLMLDLRPDLTAADLAARLARVPPKQSLSTRLAKATKLEPAAIAVLRDIYGEQLPRTPAELASALKAVPLTVTGLAGFERAISTAGGIARTAIDDRMMLHTRPGTFIAGEMLDWDAPTGGYLLQATYATACTAADGLLAWLAAQGAGKRADVRPIRA